MRSIAGTYTQDIGGYVPLPGDRFEHFDFDLVSEDLSEPAILEHWAESWFPEICAANAAQLAEDQAAIAAWRNED